MIRRAFARSPLVTASVFGLSTNADAISRLASSTSPLDIRRMFMHRAFSRRPDLHGQSLGADHRPRIVEFRRLFTGDRDFPVPLEQSPERDLGLQPGQGSSQAEMDAVA